MVRRLRAAGALIVGKVRTTEFAWSQRTLPTLNPLDHGISTGGSSSGPAAAIASAQVPVALGTDTGGSIRIPAVQCGLVGIKPTFGVVGRGGVLPAQLDARHGRPARDDVRGRAPRARRDRRPRRARSVVRPARPTCAASGRRSALRPPGSTCAASGSASSTNPSSRSTTPRSPLRTTRRSSGSRAPARS